MVTEKEITIRTVVTLLLLILCVSSAWAGKTADWAYEALQEGRLEEALTFFQWALEDEPKNWDLWENYGYLLLKLGRRKEAQKVFEKLTTITPPRERARLQLAHIYLETGKKKKSRELLIPLTYSTDPEVAAEAKNLFREAQEKVFWLDLYAFPYYSTRFSLINWEAHAKVGIKSRFVDPYIAIITTGDTRSREDEIFNENLLGVYLGVQKEVFRGLAIYGQYGYFYRFEKGLEEEREGGDFQGGARYYGLWRQNMWFEELYIDLSYYERYDNCIGYLQARGGIEVPWKELVSQIYLGFYGVGDTEKDYWNNLLEGKIGIRFGPKKFPYISLVAEYVRGYYLGVEGDDPNPYGRWYDEGRFGILVNYHIDF